MKNKNLVKPIFNTRMKMESIHNIEEVYKSRKSTKSTFLHIEYFLKYHFSLKWFVLTLWLFRIWMLLVALVIGIDCLTKLWKCTFVPEDQFFINESMKRVGNERVFCKQYKCYRFCQQWWMKELQDSLFFFNNSMLRFNLPGDW